MPHSSGCFKAREPMRQAANSTIATTAGLMPYSTPATAGTSPKRRYTHVSATRMNSEGSTNRPPAMTPPQVRCISQPM